MNTLATLKYFVISMLGKGSHTKNLLTAKGSRIGMLNGIPK
tara:strand:- start:2127 stop:2249 length:123 start_codon:yes stop_codon:yes gene_type:complete